MLAVPRVPPPGDPCPRASCLQSACRDGQRFPRKVQLRGGDRISFLPSAATIGAVLSHGLPSYLRESRDDLIGTLPFSFLHRELLLAGSGNAVELGLAIVLRNTPFRGDRSFLLQFQQDGIQRSVIDGEQVLAGLLD